jgi:RNA polymerase sigma factor (sigma-70 family)
MQKVWELYTIAITIIEKLCHNKCSHLKIIDIVQECEDYIKGRLENNSFQTLKNYDPNRGAKESTYLYMVISRRIIDFFNSAKYQRELSVMDSIREVESTQTEQNDYNEILDEVIKELSFEEQTYLKYRYKDELSYKEIADIFDKTNKQVAKKVENIQIKLRKKLKKRNYTLEDILL